MITWQCLSFSQLTTQQLYDLLKLRVNVFVVEQNCPYPELDDKDTQAGVFHLIGYQQQQIVACARLLPAGISYPSVSIGRVATKAKARGTGLGHQLLQQALDNCQALWLNQDIEIGAQQYLAKFYQSYGFDQTSDMYLEDDIPHIDMKLSR
ncbi:GNAT family N-acetyltransferase [Vibrio sp. SA48]